jgi:hypothetical protein
MANNSVLGKTKVSSALIQTSAAREESNLVAVEIALLSLGIGAISESFIVGFLISFIVLFGLISTRAWIVLSFLFSLLWAGVGSSFAYALGGESVAVGLVVGIFVFFLMLDWHHWSLAYWRALKE